MIVRYINLRTKPAICHTIKPFVFRPFSFSASKPTISLYSKLKYILPTKSSKSPTVSTQKDVPYFDTSIQINPNLIKTHACEQAIGYQFREPLLLWEALQVPGALVHMPRYVEGNKRLAILGDMILDLLLALKWYPTWTTRGTQVSLIGHEPY